MKTNSPRTKPDPVPAGTLIDSLLERLNLQAPQYAVFRIWDEIAASYAPRSQAIGLQGRRLIVGVPSHAHRHQLALSKVQILERVNQALGTPFLKDIWFQVGTEA